METFLNIVINTTLILTPYIIIWIGFYILNILITYALNNGNLYYGTHYSKHNIVIRFESIKQINITKEAKEHIHDTIFKYDIKKYINNEYCFMVYVNDEGNDIDINNNLTYNKYFYVHINQNRITLKYYWRMLIWSLYESIRNLFFKPKYNCEMRLPEFFKMVVINTDTYKNQML